MQNIFLSEVTELKKPIEEYLINKIENPDPGSEFDMLTKWLRTLPKEHRIPGLKQAGYNTYMMLDEKNNDSVVGFVGFQRKEQILNIFRFEIEEKYRGNNYQMQLIETLLGSDYTKTNNINKVKIGKWPSDTDNPNSHSVNLISKLQKTGKYNVDTNNHTITL